MVTHRQQRYAFFFIFGIAAALTCAPLQKGEDNRPTLLIVNNGIERVRVANIFGLTLARVFPGERECIELTRNQQQQLLFETAFEQRLGPEFNPFARAGWSVVLYNSLVYDVLSLSAADRCS